MFIQGRAGGLKSGLLPTTKLENISHATQTTFLEGGETQLEINFNKLQSKSD